MLKYNNDNSWLRPQSTSLTFAGYYGKYREMLPLEIEITQKQSTRSTIYYVRA